MTIRTVAECPGISRPAGLTVARLINPQHLYWFYRTHRVVGHLDERGVRGRPFTDDDRIPQSGQHDASDSAVANSITRHRSPTVERGDQHIVQPQ